MRTEDMRKKRSAAPNDRAARKVEKMLIEVENLIAELKLAGAAVSSVEQRRVVARERVFRNIRASIRRTKAAIDSRQTTSSYVM